MSEIAIRAEKISKSYRIYRNSADRLKELITFGQRSFHEEFRALNDISLTIRKGERLGIIGVNGSGKSTLLQIIAGVLQPSSGIIERTGTVASLLELGAGFNPEFTGRSNVYMNGAIMGYSQKEMERRMPEIEAFAEIGEFIDQPVKTYSSGMYVRLAFAAAIHVDPDILIVDEALAVGDAKFQAKCYQRIKSLMNRGLTLLFVSHDTHVVRELCTQAIVLSHGHVVEQGDTVKATDYYHTSLMFDSKDVDEHRVELDSNTVFYSLNFKSDIAAILGYSFDCTSTRDMNQSMTPLPKSNQVEDYSVNVGERVRLTVFYTIHAALEEPVVVEFILKNTRDSDLIGTSTYFQETPVPYSQHTTHSVSFDFDVNLRPGKYTLTASLHKGASNYEGSYHLVERFAVLTVVQASYAEFGIVYSNAETEVRQMDRNE